MIPTINPGKKSESGQEDKNKNKENGTKPEKNDNADNEKFSPGEPDDYNPEEFATD